MTILTAILAIMIFSFAQYQIAKYALRTPPNPKEKRPPRVVLDYDFYMAMECRRCGADFVEVDGKLKCPRCKVE